MVSVLLKEQLLINIVRMLYLIPPTSGPELISGSCVRPCALEKSHPRIHKWEERMMWCGGRMYERKSCQCERAKVKQNWAEMYHSSGSWWTCKVCTIYWEYPALLEKRNWADACGWGVTALASVATAFSGLDIRTGLFLFGWDCAQILAKRAGHGQGPNWSSWKDFCASCMVSMVLHSCW